MGDSTIERVLHDLKVISAIRENDKLFTDNGCLNLDHGGIGSSLYRFVNGENRNKGLASVNNIFQDAFAIAENAARRIENIKEKDREASIMKMKTFHVMVQMKNSLKAAIVGIKHLRATYQRDTSAVAKIDVLKERAVNATLTVQQQCDHISSAHNLYYETDDVVGPLELGNFSDNAQQDMTASIQWD